MASLRSTQSTYSESESSVGGRSWSTRWSVAIGFAAVLLVYGLMTWRFDFVCDDAYISFRYSRHLAEGHGLRFNVGEDPPVEGYTNFLWVLALAPFEAIGWPAPICSRVMSVACGLVLIWRLMRLLHRRLELSGVPLMLGVGFFASFPPVVVWSTSGLATIPFALCIFWTFECLMGESGRILGMRGGVAAALTILMRADGFIWVAALIGLTAFVCLLRRDRDAVKPLAICAAIAGLAFGGLVAFRLWYFGWPMPNTFYAKVGLSPLALERGSKYVASFFLTFPHVMIVWIAGAIAGWKCRHSQPIISQAALMAGFGFAYGVIVGGDFMTMWRMLVPAVGFLAILFAALAPEQA